MPQAPAKPEHEGFAENLRLLCSYKQSVSEVCRKLGINRQQFARYLAGDSLPSRGNMRKICDYFGVEEHEINLPPKRFRDLIILKPEATKTAQAHPMPVYDGLFFEISGKQSYRYTGYYYRYLRSTGYRGAIIKACVKIFESDGRLCIKSLERLRFPTQARKNPYDVFKYKGVFAELSDRIFIIEADSILQNGITETVLYPSHKNPMTYLFGQTFGVTSDLSREPFASPIVYEFLGVDVELRSFIADSGLLPDDGTALDPRVWDYLSGGGR